jgi:hypothetical protein
VLFSGLAERLRKQVEQADPNFDFASWLHTDENVAALGWNVKDVVTYIKDVDLAERKAWLLEVLEGMKQHFLEREHAQQARNARHDQALMVQRSLPGSSEALDKILRYETTIERQLFRAITELEKLQLPGGARPARPAVRLGRRCRAEVEERGQGEHEGQREDVRKDGDRDRRRAEAGGAEHRVPDQDHDRHDDQCLGRDRHRSLLFLRSRAVRTSGSRPSNTRPVLRVPAQACGFMPCKDRPNDAPQSRATLRMLGG